MTTDDTYVATKSRLVEVTGVEFASRLLGRRRSSSALSVIHTS
jgi:hypothetical protein